jgi:CrcB protein
MTAALLVALGAAVGAPARYLVDRSVRRRVGAPWGTVAVNVAGSFVLGLLVARTGGSGGWYLAVGTGFCGALTTYSTFAYETVHQAGAGNVRQAAVEATVGVSLGVLAAAGGFFVAGA